MSRLQTYFDKLARPPCTAYPTLAHRISSSIFRSVVSPRSRLAARGLRSLLSPQRCEYKKNKGRCPATSNTHRSHQENMRRYPLLHSYRKPKARSGSETRARLLLIWLDQDQKLCEKILKKQRKCEVTCSYMTNEFDR